MEKINKILISGHAQYGRLETLRDYFILRKAEILVVIYFDLAFSKKKNSKIEIYEKGVLKNTFDIYNFYFNLLRR